MTILLLAQHFLRKVQFASLSNNFKQRTCNLYILLFYVDTEALWPLPDVFPWQLLKRCLSAYADILLRPRFRGFHWVANLQVCIRRHIFREKSLLGLLLNLLILREQVSSFSSRNMCSKSVNVPRKNFHPCTFSWTLRSLPILLHWCTVYTLRKM